jgi:hypothetical protein
MTDPRFPAALTPEELEQGLKARQEWQLIYRAAMVLLTHDAAELLTPAQRSPTNAEALRLLFDDLSAYLKWLEAERSLLESALARIGLVLTAVAETSATPSTPPEENPDAPV